MKFRISHVSPDVTDRIYGNPGVTDSIVITGETIADCREEAAKETSRRGWNEDDCWSEEIPEKEDK